MPWGVLALTAFFGGLIQTVIGFGNGMVMMLVLPYFLGMIAAPALSGAACVGLNLTLVWKFRHYFDFKAVALPVGVYVVCSVLIIRQIQGINMDVLSLVYGIFLLLFAIYLLFFSEKIHFKADWKSAILCGGISGVLSGLFGIGGPLMAVYFVSASKSKEAYISNTQSAFAVTGTVNTTVRILKGIYTADLITLTLLSIIFINIGKRAGLHIVDKLNTRIIQKLVYILVAASGILAIWEQV